MINKYEKNSVSRVIIVEANPGQLKILYRILRDSGYDVQTATTSELALYYISLSPPDLIMLAVRMPALNGIELCRRVKSISKLKSIPVIFLNDFENINDKPHCFQVGAAAYLTKPYDPQEVMTCVDTNLRLSYMSRKWAELTKEPAISV